MCVFTFLFIYIYIYVYIYIYLCIYICVYIHTYTYVCLFVCLSACMYVCVYIYIYIYVCVCVCLSVMAQSLSCRILSRKNPEFEVQLYLKFHEGCSWGLARDVWIGLLGLAHAASNCPTPFPMSVCILGNILRDELPFMSYLTYSDSWSSFAVEDLIIPGFNHVFTMFCWVSIQAHRPPMAMARHHQRAPGLCRLRLARRGGLCGALHPVRGLRGGQGPGCPDATQLPWEGDTGIPSGRQQAMEHHNVQWVNQQTK